MLRRCSSLSVSISCRWISSSPARVGRVAVAVTAGPLGCKFRFRDALCFWWGTPPGVTSSGQLPVPVFLNQAVQRLLLLPFSLDDAVVGFPV